MRIVHINTITIAPGMQVEARQLVAEAQQYYSKKEPKVPRTFLISVAGRNPQHVHTRITTYDSLSQWEASAERQAADPELQAIAKKAARVFLPETREFTIHEVL